MNEETVVAVFRTATQADAALRDLHAVGIPDSALSRHASMDPPPPDDERAGDAASRDRDAADAGLDAGDEATHRRGFWERLFGGAPSHDISALDDHIAGGGVVVTVRTSDVHVDAVVELLERHDPDDIVEQVVLSDIVAGGCPDHEPSLAERRIDAPGPRLRLVPPAR